LESLAKGEKTVRATAGHRGKKEVGTRGGRGQTRGKGETTEIKREKEAYWR